VMVVTVGALFAGHQAFEEVLTARFTVDEP
jgi:hypothetical protein